MDLLWKYQEPKYHAVLLDDVIYVIGGFNKSGEGSRCSRGI